MKTRIYNLYVNNRLQYCHHDLRVINREKQHVIELWENAQHWGNGYWYGEPYPEFEIRTYQEEK